MRVRQVFMASIAASTRPCARALRLVDFGSLSTSQLTSAYTHRHGEGDAQGGSAKAQLSTVTRASKHGFGLAPQTAAHAAATHKMTYV